MFGLINLKKTQGITSRQAINVVQRLVKPAKIGHAGTLDPLATGVLVVTIGPATRLTTRIQAWPKTYCGTFLLGRTSETEDTEGTVVALPDARVPTRADLEGAAEQLTGTIQQRPPAYSALKVRGQRAYKLARAGQQVELAARTIHIHELRIERYEYPELDLHIACSSGTYVRSLGRDLAESVGTSAVMSALTRTSVGHLTLERAVDADTLTRDNICEHLIPAIEAVRDLPRLQLTSEQLARLTHGAQVHCPDQEADELAAVTSDGKLAAVMTAKRPHYYGPQCNFVAVR